MMFLLILISCFFIISMADDPYVFNNKTFPHNFMIGVSTAAYQIEGAWNADGKGESVWDHRAHDPNSDVQNKSTGDVACDSYHLYKTDVEMLKYLGVSHYRFSIAWTRILPNGTGTVANKAGVQYYKNLIKLLVANNIQPVVTLHHFDSPMVLEKQGGFYNDSFPNWFANYARICFREFGDDVKFWGTFNEPVSGCNGQIAIRPYICAHHIIKAHAAAWHVYDKEFRNSQKGKVTMVHSSFYYGAATNKTEDIEAADRGLEFSLGWWANPLYHGDYPEVMKARIAKRSKLEGYARSRLPEFTEEEKKFIKGTSDIFFFNTYYSYHVRAIPEPPIVKPPTMTNDLGINAYFPLAINGAWGVVSHLKWIEKHFDNPEIMMTENGFRSRDDRLADPERIVYTKHYLSRIRDAIEDGVKITGYTHWSLMDNFEWNLGYNPKFGLYQVDFSNPNRTRTPRMSANWYKQMIKSRCLVDKCI